MKVRYRVLGTSICYTLEIEEAARALVPGHLAGAFGGEWPPPARAYAKKIEADLRDALDDGCAFTRGRILIDAVGQKWSARKYVALDPGGIFAIIEIEGSARRRPWVRGSDGSFQSAEHRDWRNASRKGNRVMYVYHLRPGIYTTSDHRSICIQEDGSCVEISE